MKKISKLLVVIISLWFSLLDVEALITPRYNTLALNSNTTYDIPVDGIYDYDFAKEIFKIVNEERANEGSDPLQLDNDLVEYAMIRAKELAVYFSHTRPDGTSALTGRAFGENIIANRNTPEDAMTGWMNSAGHRSNILELSFKSIGVGCYKTNSRMFNGVYYCAQVFSYYESANQTVNSGTVSKGVEIVKILPEYVDYDLNLLSDNGQSYLKYNTVEKGKSINIEYLDFINTGWQGSRFPIPLTYATYRSSNDNVFRVDPSGVITGVGDGDAQLIVDLYGLKKTYDFKVGTYLNSASADTIVMKVGDKKDIEYTLDPSNATILNTSFVSRNEDIVKIEDNKLVALKEGKARIVIFLTPLNHSGSYAVPFDVIVSNTPIEVQGIYFPSSNYELSVGEKIKLTPNITPTYATDKNLKFYTANNDVVDVDNDGNVTAKSSGVALVYAEAPNGIKARTIITVHDYLKGDLNENGTVNSLDALEALYFAIGERDYTSRKIAIGDFNGDNKIMGYDAIEIIKLYIG